MYSLKSRVKTMEKSLHQPKTEGHDEFSAPQLLSVRPLCVARIESDDTVATFNGSDTTTENQKQGNAPVSVINQRSQVNAGPLLPVESISLPRQIKQPQRKMSHDETKRQNKKIILMKKKLMIPNYRQRIMPTLSEFQRKSKATMDFQTAKTCTRNIISGEKVSDEVEKRREMKEMEAGITGRESNNGTAALWKTQINTTIHDFVGETTAHGYKRTTAKHRGRVGKILWMLAIIAVTAAVLQTLHDVLQEQEFYSFSSSIKSQPYAKMVFPAVTICNLIPYDTSLFPTILSHDSDTVRRFLLQLARLHNIPDISNSTEIWDLLQNFTTADLDDMIGWKVDNMLSRCYWNEVPVACSEIFVRSESDSDICFTFNSDPANPRLVDRAGSFSGLSLLIKVADNKGFVSPLIPSGAKVLIHEPGDYPNTREKGMLVAPGTTTYISMAKKEYKFLPKPFKAYGTEYCSDDTDTPDDVTTSGSNMVYHYSCTGHSDCMAKCRLKKVIEKCGCLTYAGKTVFPDVPTCGVGMYEFCYIPVLNEAYMQSPLNKSYCACSLPCRKVEFTSQISMTTFPKSPYLQEANVSNYVNLKIFYEDLVTTVETHLPMYSWSKVFGTLGGQMGLFTGASVLTILEFAELGLLMLSMAFQAARSRFKHQKRKVVVPQ